MGNSRNKILILSLGTGYAGEEKNGKHVQGKDDVADSAFEKLINEQYKYKMGNYCFGMDDEPKSSPFVGEVLLETFRPKQLVIIGTIKSMWDAFYFRFSGSIDTEERRKSFAKLWEIENRNIGYKTEQTRLNDAELEIENELNKLNEILGLEKIKVILVEYGPGEKAESNYRKIASLRCVFNENCVNEVAFDITHSFRSIPVYNLTVLNYLKALGEYKIEISNVYYGNLDISTEIEKRALIQNLSYLINVIDLTDAVTSFRITGNVGILIEKLKQINMDETLLVVLKEYEWATETNNFECIIKSLEKMYSIRQEKESDMVSDAWKMLIEILKVHFPEKILKAAKTIDGKAKMQYELANWYYEQKKYGLFLATAQEAIRSYLLPLYCKKKGKNIEDNEQNRRDAMAELNFQGEKLESMGYAENETVKIIIHMAKQQQRIRPIRNIFAHCLEDNEHTFQYNMDDLRIVQEFQGALKVFCDHMENPEKKKQFIKYFETEPVKKQLKNSGNALRIIIGNNREEFKASDMEYFRYSCKRIYDVRQLEENQLKQINRESTAGKRRIRRVSAILEMVKEEKEMGRERIAIVLYKIKEAADMVAVCMEFSVQKLDSDVKVYIYEKSNKVQLEPVSPFKIVNIPKIE